MTNDWGMPPLWKEAAKRWLRNKLQSCFCGRRQEKKSENNINQLKHPSPQRGVHARAAKILTGI